MVNKAKTIFVNREEIEKVPGLWKFINSEGLEFSTFSPDKYPLGTELEISYEIVQSGNKGQYKQNRLVDKASPAVIENFRQKIPPQTNGQVTQWMPPIPNDLDTVNKKLDRLILMVEGMINSQNPLL